MNRLDVRVLADADGKRRVVVFQRCSGTFGYVEQRYLDGPAEFRWIDVDTPRDVMCDTEADAVRMARARLDWLSAD